MGSVLGGQCSATCGASRKSNTRKCDHPKPSDGGRKCPGIDEEEESCSVDLCPGAVIQVLQFQDIVTQARIILSTFLILVND